MIVRLFMLILVFAPFASTVEAGLWDNIKSLFGGRNRNVPPIIRVLVTHDQPSVMLEVKGKYNVYDPNTKAHMGTRLIGKCKLIQSLPSGLKWGEEFPGIYQLHIVPENQSITTVVNEVEYQGSLFVYDIGGTISIINAVDLEDYLTSVLTPQFHEPLSEETLSAIAITARTYAYYRTLHPKNPFWGVDSEQVIYAGLASIDTDSAIEKAVQSTKYMVLSLTGAYEGRITPIAAQWGSGTGSVTTIEPAVFSRISLYEAEEMAKNGAHAAQILSKAYPNTHIELVY